MCVHSQDSLEQQAWGYYDGPRDTRDPEEAFPHWKQDDSSLRLRCQSQTVRVDSRLEPDPARAPLLRRLYRRAGRLIRRECGGPLVRGKLNMEAWLVDVKCGGEDCHRTDITITMLSGRVSIQSSYTRDFIVLSPPEVLSYTYSLLHGDVTAGQWVFWSVLFGPVLFPVSCSVSRCDDPNVGCR